jgi:intraflagellar transport protein 46
VRALEHAERNPKEILKWAASIAELRRSAPPPSVHYSRPMPEIDALMQEWPPAFEELLRTVPLPTADLALSTEEYARVVCALLDIPVHGGGGGGGGGGAQPGALIQALHVLFTLFLEFKENPHFQLGAAARAAAAATDG